MCGAETGGNQSAKIYSLANAPLTISPVLRIRTAVFITNSILDQEGFSLLLRKKKTAVGGGGVAGEGGC